jgi:hypothetical protein
MSTSYLPEAVSQVSDRLVEPEKRGIFAFFMSALHSSRRHQASRVMRQYEHLLTHELKQKFRRTRMVVANRADRARLTAPSSNEMGWLLAVAAAFLIVHIVALTILGRASTSEAMNYQPETISLLCD